MKRHRIAVALSGGIDSAYAAAILKEEGCELLGVTMRLPGSNEEDLKDAASISDQLGIEHLELNLSDVFQSRVVDPFVSDYRRGLTPNPCVLCNRTVKFGALLEAVNTAGCDLLATGHYARSEFDSEAGIWRLFRGINDRRDQAYYLHGLSQAQLSKVRFPLGEIRDKAQVIKHVERQFGGEMTRKGESRGICFLQGGSLANYLAGTSEAPGIIVDQAGKTIGVHRGVWNFTVGQKRGLGLEPEGAWTVLAIDGQSRIVTVGSDADCYSGGLTAASPSFIHKAPEPGRLVSVKMFRWGYEIPAVLESVSEDQFKLRFLEPQRAVAPGQFAVLYDGHEVLGGGRIIGK